MGFRSTMVSEDWDITWPDWFREKWTRLLLGNPEAGRALLGVAVENKTGHYSELPADVQRALTEVDWFHEHGDPGREFVYVWLHECGGITRVQVECQAILITTPTEWTQDWADGESEWHNQDAGHSYCYGCSDARRAKPMVVDGTPPAAELDPSPPTDRSTS
jgi:hypothetical protein